MTTATPQTQFPQPNEIEGSWDWDKIHAPRPLTPQAGDAIIMAMGEGFTIAQHDFGSTLELRCKMVNNYFYAAFVPDPSYTPPTTDIWLGCSTEPSLRLSTPSTWVMTSGLVRSISAMRRATSG